MKSIESDRAFAKSIRMHSSLSQHVERVQVAIASQAAAKSALVASWRRSSAAHRLDPAEYRPPRRLTETELKTARQSIEPLLRVAQSSLDRLFLAVGGAGCCVMLADRSGVPVDRRGVASDDKTFDSWGLWQGAVWSEDSQGTNGIGTCIVERRTLTIHRDQHFLARNSLMSCTTAPIFDHLGELAAVIDVSSCRADLIEGFVNLVSIAVSDAARRIEAENFRMSFSKARVMLAPVPGSLASALVAVDADDIVVGASRSARHAFGITQTSIEKALPVGTLIKDMARATEELAGAERGVVSRALANAGGNVSAAAKVLHVSRATLHRKVKKLGLSRPS